MASRWCPDTIVAFLLCLLLVSFVETNHTFEAEDEIQKMKIVKEYLQKLNKHAQKTILNFDGDYIDCVLFDRQPAFDHPLFKENISLETPRRSNGYHSRAEATQNFQLWNANGEKCPDGTIPIRRITEAEILRAPSLARFGMKSLRKKYDNGHEYAAAFSRKDKYFGAKATLNVWAPRVAGPDEFSLSQIWLVAGQYGVDLNTVEVGWHVYPRLYNDNHPRLFVYWTADAYKNTGCYNLQCPGFVHTSSKIALGSTSFPISSYNGPQYEIALAIKKDTNTGNWLLLFGPESEEVGYWPSYLFTHLKDSADTVEFGGEILNNKPSGAHTATEMGSGHFSGEKYGKAAFVRGLEVISSGNQYVPFSGLSTYEDNRRCYDIQLRGPSKNFGNYFYYGGSGLSNECR